MNAEETLKYWRDKLSCEEQVKIQLSDEYANADTKEEIKLLNEIRQLVYENES
jgi:hypothetical protein